VNRYTTKPILTVLFLCTAAAVYFMARFGVYFNPSMLHNLLETDVREASELLSWTMLPYLLILGVLPVALLWRVKIRDGSWKSAALRRGACLVGAVAMAAGGAWPVLGELIPAMRQNKEVRYLITPSNYIVSLATLMAPSPSDTKATRAIIGADASRSQAERTGKPRAFVLVVGETVRGANWGLNGYERQTTPELAERQVINFKDVTSCGTDTATSLPCMFSLYGRRHYDRGRITHSESLLHVLHRAGVSVLWRDNQVGCKGVCDGLQREDLSNEKKPGLCAAERCFDAILLDDLKSKIDAQPDDLIIVLHMLGNHGPAYYQRYPSQFRRWTPTCDTTELSSCPRANLVNTYDNAILYGDHVLASAIDLLSEVTSHDTALLYVSDHGESLGEGNLYLHGMPYSIAPVEQTHVPMIMWYSPGFSASIGLDVSCLTARAIKPASHDHLFNTVLGLFDVHTSVYEPDWDLTAACRH
jgi:lipid A ethanolaminephosphotransferase